MHTLPKIDGYVAICDNSVMPLAVQISLTIYATGDSYRCNVTIDSAFQLSWPSATWLNYVPQIFTMNASARRKTKALLQRQIAYTRKAKITISACIWALASKREEDTPLPATNISRFSPS